MGGESGSLGEQRVKRRAAIERIREDIKKREWAEL